MNLRILFMNFGDVFFHKLLEVKLTDCNSVLDIGCGFNSPIRSVKKTFYSEGIDIYKSNILQSKKKKIHDRYVIGDIRDLTKYYKYKSFDGIIAIDVIEHFEKKEALVLLKQMEKIARKKIILLTPNGFVSQKHHDDNPYQKHKSGWRKNDLVLQGYKVYGLRGLKYIRKELATLKYKPWIIWGFIAFITEPLLYYFPLISFDLFAIKDLRKVKKIYSHED